MYAYVPAPGPHGPITAPTDPPLKPLPLQSQTQSPIQTQQGQTLSQTLSQTSPTRPKHLATRSITETIPSNISLTNAKVHRHHHHHPHILRHKPSDSQTALQIATSDRAGSKSEGVTPQDSRNVSRKGSVSALVEGVSEMMGGESGFGGLDWKTVRVVREGEVKEEREKGALRAIELRNALLGLNALSNNTTRRLDNTYYSVLEKLSMLQSTITSMKELASMARQLNGEFEMESQELVTDVNSQIDIYEGFDEQEKRISALAERVRMGREKIKDLGGRVELVKTRVEGWEAAEAEWKEKTRRRLRLLWILMGIAGGIFVLVMIFQNLPAKTPGQDAQKALNASGLLGKMPDMEPIKNETREMQRKIGQALEGLRDKDRADEDSRLRVFDEL